MKNEKKRNDTEKWHGSMFVLDLMPIDFYSLSANCFLIFHTPFFVCACSSFASTLQSIIYSHLIV